MPALDDPQTRTALDAVRAGAVRWLAGGVVAVVLAALLGAAVVRMTEDGAGRPPFAGLLVVTLAAVGLVGVVTGLGGLLRVRRWTAALGRIPWQGGVLRIAGPALLQVEPLGSDELLQLRLMSTAAWRARAVQRLDGAEIRYAEVSPREWVLSADGAGTVYGARVGNGR